MSSDSMQRWCDPRVILVATNLCDQPTLMHHAVAEAKRSGARLLLVHVIPPPAQLEDGSSGHSRILLLPSTSCAAETLEHMALLLQWQGVLCEPIVLKGCPEEQIRALVQSRQVDRVIVAARGCPPAAASSRPSLAENLMAGLGIPVSVVSGHIDPVSLSGIAVGRVLLALSLHSIRREYVDFAFGLAKARGARLTLLHVVDPSVIPEPRRASAHDAARLQLAALAATHDELRRRPDIAVREGDPAAQIVEQAGCPFQDVIVLGASSLTSSSVMQSNTIVHRVLADARCPVITLKPFVLEMRAATEPAWPILKTGSLD